MTKPTPATIDFPFIRPGPDAETEIRQHHPKRIALVALDIGKDVHHLYIRTAAHQDIVPPMKIPTLNSGYQQVISHLDSLLASGAYDLVLLGHEPTGIYHEAWSQALVERYHAHRIGETTPALRYRLVHTVLVKQERQRKTHRQRRRPSGEQGYWSVGEYGIEPARFRHHEVGDEICNIVLWQQRTQVLQNLDPRRLAVLWLYGCDVQGQDVSEGWRIVLEMMTEML